MPSVKEGRLLALPRILQMPVSCAQLGWDLEALGLALEDPARAAQCFEAAHKGLAALFCAEHEFARAVLRRARKRRAAEGAIAKTPAKRARR